MCGTVTHMCGTVTHMCGTVTHMCRHSQSCFCLEVAGRNRTRNVYTYESHVCRFLRIPFFCRGTTLYMIYIVTYMYVYTCDSYVQTFLVLFLPRNDTVHFLHCHCWNDNVIVLVTKSVMQSFLLTRYDNVNSLYMCSHAITMQLMQSFLLERRCGSQCECCHCGSQCHCIVGMTTHITHICSHSNNAMAHMCSRCNNKIASLLTVKVSYIVIVGTTTHMSHISYECVTSQLNESWHTYGVATFSRLLTIIGIFWKRAL